MNLEAVERVFTPARRWAVGFFILAGVCVAVWIETNAADAWMPNAATAAVGIGLTITLVEWIIRQETERRLAPRVERVKDGFRSYLETFAEIVAISYAGAHTRSYRPVPADALHFLAQWLEDRAPQELDSGQILGVPIVLSLGFDLADEVGKSRVEDREVMDPDLVGAIDDFRLKVTAARTMQFLVEQRLDDTPEETIRRAEVLVVEGVLAFGEAFVRWDKGKRVVLGSRMLAEVEKAHERSPSP
jgi:hypothetical protein